MHYLFALLALAVAAILAIGYWASGLLVHGRHRPLTRTPQEYGLSYEDVTFLSKDGLRLSGWWIPVAGNITGIEADHPPAVILLHSMFGNRHGGYVAGKPARSGSECPDLLSIACAFQVAGYAALLFDFRNHGQSQAGIGGGGLNEDQDVAGAVDYTFRRLAAEAPDETPQVGVVGFGLGAVAAICAVGREKGGAETIRVFSSDNEGASGILEFPAPNTKKLAFLVAVRPASLRTWLDCRLRRIFPPLSLLLLPTVDRFCQWRGSYPLGSHLLLEFAREVRIPTLYVQGCPDRRGECDDVQQLYEAAPGPKELWQMEKPPDWPEAHQNGSVNMQRLLTFAAKYVLSAASM